MNTERLQRILLQATGRQDLMLIALLVAVIFMMILPLPTVIVDILVAVNMASAVILLMVAIYLKSPLQFTSFPSVLLVTTLFRLALGISTTRLILLHGDAGHIIDTFGKFVVGGNLVVGIVVFLIITIVQFIVVTKGSERVAEVSARFSLDAMPGKQMSIDSDMRAGNIDLEEAKRRRGEVEKESQLFGAMDGAMKFVKGDAIAGLIIVFVNLIGGLAIGTLQKGMAAGDALQKYAILTIGDGLVSQIPALFISICAGMIVTRVTNEDLQDLGRDIGGQIFADYRTMQVAAVILVGFGLIPGFPTSIFLVLAAACGGGAYYMMRQTRAAQVQEASEAAGSVPAMSPAGEKPQTKPRKPGEERADFALTVPVMLDVSPDLQEVLRPQMLNEELIKIRRALYYDLGVPFPGIHMRFNERLRPQSYYVLLQEIPISQGQVRPGWLFVRDEVANLDLLGPCPRGWRALPAGPGIGLGQ